VSGVRGTEFAGFGVSLSMDQWKGSAVSVEEESESESE